MVVDTSAILAILLEEPAAEAILAMLNDSDVSLISSVSVVEAGIVATTRWGRDGHQSVVQLLEKMNVEQIHFTAEHARLAVDAWHRFGRGQHTAGLNFGDCMTYALAAERQMPILFVGNDVSRTDIEPA